MAAALCRGAARGRGAANLFSIVAAVLVAGVTAIAQRAPEPPLAQSRDIASAVLEAAPSPDTVTVTFFNRSIVDLRATVLGRGPAERARAAAGLAADGGRVHQQSRH